MASFLQKHAGHHFTLALLELGVFVLPEGAGYVVQPRLLARTQVINRVVFEVGGSTTSAAPAVVPIARGLSASSSPKGTTLTQESFLEALERNLTGYAFLLQSFLKRLEDVYVWPDFSAKTLTLRWQAKDGTSWNLGSLLGTGEVWFDYHGRQATNANRRSESKAYLERLSAFAPGSAVKATRNGTAWNLVGEGGRGLRVDQFTNAAWGADGWVLAIQEFQRAVEIGLD